MATGTASGHAKSIGLSPTSSLSSPVSSAASISPPSVSSSLLALCLIGSFQTVVHDFREKRAMGQCKHFELQTINLAHWIINIKCLIDLHHQLHSHRLVPSNERLSCVFACCVINMLPYFPIFIIFQDHFDQELINYSCHQPASILLKQFLRYSKIILIMF